MTKKRTAAFEAGRTAGLDATPLHQNPHPRQSPKWTEWALGWCDGHLARRTSPTSLFADSSRIVAVRFRSASNGSFGHTDYHYYDPFNLEVGDFGIVAPQGYPIIVKVTKVYTSALPPTNASKSILQKVDIADALHAENAQRSRREAEVRVSTLRKQLEDAQRNLTNIIEDEYK